MVGEAPTAPSETTALAGPEKPTRENPKQSVHSGAARRREQPSGLRALGRRYGCWRPAQNRCSYGGRAGLPSALCPSRAAHSGERNLSGPALDLCEPSPTGAPIDNLGQRERELPPYAVTRGAGYSDLFCPPVLFLAAGDQRIHQWTASAILPQTDRFPKRYPGTAQ